MHRMRFCTLAGGPPFGPLPIAGFPAIQLGEPLARTSAAHRGGSAYVSPSPSHAWMAVARGERIYARNKEAFDKAKASAAAAPGLIPLHRDSISRPSLT